ncbi:MAG TPA: permease-like cell division protein FtsX [Candidatus Manganitrophaceae bacterium]|nr:permease-like cell division protein FtsX [Candidatus Manganitrophaceae bacterium]
MGQFIYFFKTALENIQINRVMTLLSLVSLSLTLTLFGLFLLFYYNVQIVLETMREDVQFSVYLSDAAEKEAIEQIRNKLSEQEGVLSFHYISKEEALELFQKEFHDEALIKSLGANPLPASFEVKVKASHQDPQKLAMIVDRFRALPGVEEAQYGSEWLQNLTAFLKILKMVGLGMGALLATAVVTIIANTARLHFYNRKDEIEIMKLIGATPGFIKIPFFLEGSLMGILSGAFSVLTLFVIFNFYHGRLQSVGGMIGGVLNLHFLPAQSLSLIVLGGGVLGWIGSFISLATLLRLRLPNDGKRRR